MYEVYIGNILFPVAPEKIVYKTKSRNSVISLVNDEEISRIKTGSLTEYSFDENLKKYKKVFDPREYALKLCAASTVYPDLKNAALQESYGVMGEERLLGKMLTGGEYERYLEKVQQINGYGKAMNELKEEAKN